MLAMIYLGLASFVGFNLLKSLLPGLWKTQERKTLLSNKADMPSWMVILPASFLSGTLILTWFSYICAYVFRNTREPMLWGNLLSFFVFSLLMVIFAFKKKQKYNFSIKTVLKLDIKRIKNFLDYYTTEIIYIVIITCVWTFFMFRSFYIKDGSIFTGISVFSDFAPHLSVIRSFSYGSNFPTEYPHFADGTIRYHFMFQFLAGNLEYLGMRLDWAFNLPSILSMISFLMLLYSFSLLVTGKKWTGIIASVLFFFRSSFAFFTYINKIYPQGNILERILQNKEHIGNTLREEWGLWAQKVYVNQRHLSFGLGILLLVLIIIYPLLLNMFDSLKKCFVLAKKKYAEEKKECFFLLKTKFALKEFIFSKNAWMFKDITPSLACGLLMGLSSYWNGAVVISGLSILLIMAVFSKQRLAYLNIALITILLSFVQTSFFINDGASAVSPRLTIGFLSGSTKLMPILKFYFELLGIIPLLLLAGLLTMAVKYRFLGALVFLPLTLYAFFFMAPDFPLLWKLLLAIAVMGAHASYMFFNIPPLFRGAISLIAAFAAPVLLATTLQLTPDITVNHKYILISIILLNIPIAYFILNMFLSKKVVPTIFACTLTLTLTITGAVDIITLYNLDKDSIKISIKDPLLVWAEKNTGANELFLTGRYSLHPLLLSGRKIFCGWPYYPWSAGYDTGMREDISKKIYGADDKEILRLLVEKHNIIYIVIDRENRDSNSYKLNEALIKDSFINVYDSGNVTIYRTY